MGEFMAAAFAFPAVLFTYALLIVVGYWVVVLLGSVEVDALDADAGTGDGIGAEGLTGFTGFVTGLGLGGVPVTVALSFLITIAWFMSLTGTVLLADRELPGPAATALGLGVVAAALVVAWLGTRLLLKPLRRLLRPAVEPSRRDFVGRPCVIRTGQVGPGFGQAEVTADDGSSAVIQVRQSADDARGTGGVLVSGATALIFDYSSDGEFFRVMPYPRDLGTVPERRAR